MSTKSNFNNATTSDQNVKAVVVKNDPIKMLQGIKTADNRGLGPAPLLHSEQGWKPTPKSKNPVLQKNFVHPN